jgi:catechol 2,3-dioxygenase-like lactoylglutathione lyase family enzyme
MIKGVHHVAVHVRDLDAMVTFYRDAFGFEPIDEGFSWTNNPVVAKLIDVPYSEAKGIMLRTGNCYLELFQYRAPDPVSTRPLAPYDRGYTHFCVEMNDIARQFERLRALGMTFGHTEPVDAGPTMAIYGKDPEGNIIEILECKAECTFSLDELSARD